MWLVRVTGDLWLLLQVQILRANSLAGVLLEEIDAELAKELGEEEDDEDDEDEDDEEEEVSHSIPKRPVWPTLKRMLLPWWHVLLLKHIAQQLKLLLGRSQGQAWVWIRIHLSREGAERRRASACIAIVQKEEEKPKPKAKKAAPKKNAPKTDSAKAAQRAGGKKGGAKTGAVAIYTHPGMLSLLNLLPPLDVKSVLMVVIMLDASASPIVRCSLCGFTGWVPFQ